MLDHDVVERKAKIASLDYETSTKVLWQWSKEGRINLREFKELLAVVATKKEISSPVSESRRYAKELCRRLTDVVTGTPCNNKTEVLVILQAVSMGLYAEGITKLDFEQKGIVEDFDEA